MARIGGLHGQKMCIRDSLSADTYRAGFGTAPQFTTLIAHAADDSAEGRSALSAELLGQDGVSGVSMVSDLKDSFSNMMEKIDTIVVVLIVSAGLLAFVVLYNLTNINIAERVKEIATLKVLGFFDKEVSAYVYRENVMLSIMGTAVGQMCIRDSPSPWRGGRAGQRPGAAARPPTPTASRLR